MDRNCRMHAQFLKRVTAQELPYNSKHAVLMFRSWPEPLLQVDRMASCKAAQRQQLPLAAALQEPCNSCAS